MNIENGLKLDFKHVLIRPKRSPLTSRSQVDITRTFTFSNSGGITWTGVPIMAANMDTVGTFEMANKLKKYGMATALHKHYSVEDLAGFFDETEKDASEKGEDVPMIFYSMGVTQADSDKLAEFVKQYRQPRFLCVDVANGYSDIFVDHLKHMRDILPDTVIMAGNVVTSDIVYELASVGVDIVKVGIGPGSVCTTRVKTGVGYPQLSAIMECADAAHQMKAFICGDGGCTVPGDLAKAFGAGADFTMLGGMLSGHEECDGTVITKRYLTNEIEMVEDTNGFAVVDVDPIFEDKKYMKFYGMSSAEAMNKYAGGVANYRASEGKCVEVPYKGAVDSTIGDILGGLRSACTYVGAQKLKHLPKHTTFVLVAQQENTIFS